MWAWTLLAVALSVVVWHLVTKRGPRALVLVLGDLGRSPRMQFHCKSLADAGFQVDFVGYNETVVPSFLLKNPRVQIHSLTSCRKLPSTIPRWMYLVWAVLRILWQLGQLFYVLCALPSPSFILCQTPPAVPTLLVVQILCHLRNSKLVIDWHNFGYSIMALNLGKHSSIVKWAKRYEKIVGNHAYAHLCVSHAMLNFLKREWKLRGKIIVLHDKAPLHFQPLQIFDKNEFLSRMVFEKDEVRFSSTKSRTSEANPDFDYLLVSSTSWTEDEDFSILLDALSKFDRKQRTEMESAVRVLLIITGKGPLKDFYLSEIRKLSMEYVSIKTAWLTAEDYPLLLGSADLGISLHTSSSGLDLPMKIVDMFGCGLPVCAIGYPCLAELVEHGVNGLIFQTSDELCDRLWVLLRPGSSTELHKLKLGTEAFRKNRWSTNWDTLLKPLLLPNAS